MGTFQKICEDSAEVLVSDTYNRPAEMLLPKFLEFFKHSQPKIRSLAINCMNSFILVRSEILLKVIDLFLEVKRN